MSVEAGSEKNAGWLTALIVLALVVVSLLALVLIVEPAKIMPAQTQTPDLTAVAPQLTPAELDALVSPVVNIDGIAILGGILVLIILAAVFREVLIHRHTPAK